MISPLLILRFLIVLMNRMRCGKMNLAEVLMNADKKKITELATKEY